MKHTRILSSILAVILLLAMTGCAGNNTPAADAAESTEQTVDSSAQTPASEPQTTDTDTPTEIVPSDNPKVGVFDLEKGTVLLNSGYEMPILGIGCYLLSQELLGCA